MDGFELLIMIKTQYPQYWAIIDKPGVMDVLTQALTGDTPWSPQRIEAALQNTPYYLNTSEEYRAWDIFAATDPATALQEYVGKQMMLKDLMDQTGQKLEGELPINPWNPQINLFGPPTPYSEFLRDALAMDWDERDMKYALMLRSAGQAPSGGEQTLNATKVMRLADDYGVPLSISAVGKWSQQLTAGIVDENAVRGYLVDQAKSMYPALSDPLARGITVRQYAEPYLQIAQQELGVNPASISLTDPKWNVFMHQIDPFTNSPTSMNLHDWTALVRSAPEYGYDYTDRAREQAAAFSTKLAQMMGGIG